MYQKVIVMIAHISQENRIKLDNINLAFDDISVEDGRKITS